VLANINISEKRLPQDGKITYKSNKQFFDLRVSTLPTIHGEKIVIRILYKSKDLISLNNLGFSEKSVNTIRNILKVSNGIILLTGPTGSGKSTTLYAMLNEIDKVKKNIITIEDPVEYTMEGINQVNVNPKAKLTFAEGLRSILRQDPDVIMVGEIRDEETAQIAIRAAITGHLVLTTLHTNNALDSISRLADMKVPQYLISDALVGIIAQRLIRKLCSSCKEEYLPSVEEKTMLGIDSNTKLFKSRGCVKCSNKGYKGRCVVYEIFTVDDEQRYLIQKGKYGEELKKSYYKGNVFSLKENCLELIKKGVTSFEEYIRVIYAK
jgi:type IV pilus assembly protein PilB